MSSVATTTPCPVCPAAQRSGACTAAMFGSTGSGGRHHGDRVRGHARDVRPGRELTHRAAAWPSPRRRSPPTTTSARSPHRWPPAPSAAGAGVPGTASACARSRSHDGAQPLRPVERGEAPQVGCVAQGHHDPRGGPAPASARPRPSTRSTSGRGRRVDARRRAAAGPGRTPPRGPHLAATDAVARAGRRRAVPEVGGRSSCTRPHPVARRGLGGPPASVVGCRVRRRCRAATSSSTDPMAASSSTASADVATLQRRGGVPRAGRPRHDQRRSRAAVAVQHHARRPVAPAPGRSRCPRSVPTSVSRSVSAHGTRAGEPPRRPRPPVTGAATGRTTGSVRTTRCWLDPVGTASNVTKKPSTVAETGADSVPARQVSRAVGTVVIRAATATAVDSTTSSAVTVVDSRRGRGRQRDPACPAPCRRARGLTTSVEYEASARAVASSSTLATTAVP